MSETPSGSQAQVEETPSGSQALRPSSQLDPMEEARLRRQFKHAIAQHSAKKREACHHKRLFKGLYKHLEKSRRVQPLPRPGGWREAA